MFYQTLAARWPPKGPKMPIFVAGYLKLSRFHLDLKLFRARERTYIPCEFGANPFSCSRDVSYTSKKSQTTPIKQNRI